MVEEEGPAESSCFSCRQHSAGHSLPLSSVCVHTLYMYTIIYMCVKGILHLNTL